MLVSCRWWNAAAEGAVLHALSLERAGMRTMLAGSGGSPALVRAAAMGLETRDLGLEGLSLPAGLVRLRLLGGEFRPDVVAAHRSEDQLAAALALPGVPLVRVRSDIRRPSRSLPARMLDARTSLVVLTSEFMLSEGWTGGRTGPVAVVPQPVDTGRFQFSPRPMSGLLVSVGRLSEVKGHRALIRALALVPGARAVIAGADAQLTREGLLEYAASLGVADRLEMPGFVEDPRPLLARADAGAVPSLASEAVSRAAMEMMSSGLPVLAASTGSLRDIVLDGRTGLLHPPGDHETLAAQAAHLLGNPVLLERLGAGARRRAVDVYSLDAAGRNWSGLLERIRSGEQTAARAGITGVNGRQAHQEENR